MPSNTWQARLPAKFKESGPKVIETADGRQWMVEGRIWGNVAKSGQAFGVAATSTPSMTNAAKADDRGAYRWPAMGLETEPEPGIYRPTSAKYRLQDMDR